MPRTGGCLCGAIRYAIEGEILACYLCHCTDCQRAHGGAFSACALVREDGFRLLEGTPRRYEHVAESGNTVVREFCGDCGSPLFSRGPTRAGQWVVRLGTLDDKSGTAPAVHIWCDSALDWALPDDGAPRHARGPRAPQR